MVFQLPFTELLKKIRGCVDLQYKIYLVGGAIRDSFLGKPVRDLDFVVNGDSIRIARKVAKLLSGTSFSLDDKRQTVRVIYSQKDRTKFTLDFNSLQNKNIREDLRNRDFTVNAVAVDLDALNAWIDPLHGITDLQERRLVLCGASSLENDPIRILRAVRLACSHSFQMTRTVTTAITKALPRLNATSPERQRDELFQILSLQNAFAAISMFEKLRILPAIFPEIELLKRSNPPNSHDPNLWENTLKTLNHAEIILNGILFPLECDPVSDQKINWILTGLADFKKKLNKHFDKAIQSERSRRSLFLFAILCHDIGAPESTFIDWDAQMHYYGHEAEGARKVFSIGKRFALSNAEINYLQTFVLNHNQIGRLVKYPPEAIKRFIYRHFRQSGEVGIDVCLFALIDKISQNGRSIDQEQNDALMKIVLSAFSYYWYEKIMDQDMIMKGEQIMHLLHIRPGPTVGKALEALREEQAVESIHTVREAEKFIKNWYGKYRQKTRE